MTVDVRCGAIEHPEQPFRRAAAWLRRRPRVVDGAVVLAAGLPNVIAFVRSGEFEWGVPFAFAAAAVLMFRRRRPFVVLVAAAVAGAVGVLVWPAIGFPMLPFSVALYTVASVQPTRRALYGYGIGVIALVLAVAPHSIADRAPSSASSLDPFSLVAFVAGVVVKNRRDRRRWQAEFMSQQIANAALTERARIAAEMHDVVAHSLTVVVTLANGATSVWRERPEEAVAAVEQIAVVGRDALGEMNHTLRAMENADDADDGAGTPALDELVERFRRAGLPVVLDRSGAPLVGDGRVRRAVYLIVREALTNTLRHADRPTGAAVTVERGEGGLEITVDDDGRPPQRRAVPGRGLTGISRRAAGFGGTSSAGPRPGSGWRTRVVLPLTAAGEAGE